MITTIEEYNELADEGESRLICGSGESGVHYYIMHKLNKYGIFVQSREEAVRAARRLCNQYLDRLASADSVRLKGGE